MSAATTTDERASAPAEVSAAATAAHEGATAPTTTAMTTAKSKRGIGNRDS